jgi:hypothetical protein
VYEVKDFTVSESDEDVMVFSWTVSENATLYAGTLSFIILFACVEDGVDTYRWYTAINNTITIAQGMNHGEAITEEYPDILSQWKEEMQGRNYAYEGAVAKGFEGTEEEWYALIIEWAEKTTMWKAKQNTLDWVTTDDIDAMFDGTYSGVEDEEYEYFYPKFKVVDGNLIIENGGEADGRQRYN